MLFHILRRTYLLLTFILPLLISPTSAQTFFVDTSETNLFFQGESYADDFMVPGNDTKTFTLLNYMKNILGYDYFTQHGANAVDGGCKSWILAASGIKGNNTSDLEFKWWAAAQPRYFKEDGMGFKGWSYVYMACDLHLIIEGLSGAKVTVYIRRENYMAGHTSHEAVSEDSISSYGILGIENNLFSYGFNDPPGPSGWNKVVLDTSFTATVGDTIHLAFEFDSYASIMDPAQYNNGGLSDGSDAVHVGTVQISLISEPQPPPMADPFAAFYFSLDIGSDTELSDPNADGDEQFDPGDIYRWRTNILPPLSTFGHHDDFWIFGFDPPPTTILNAAPTMSGYNPDSIANFYFDMDGVDFLDWDLSLEIDSLFPLPFPISWFPTQCIHNAEFLWISYDDDEAPHYIDPTGSVPVNNISPYMGVTYGTTPAQDEVTGINSMPFPPFMYITYPYSDEKFFHPVLAPNPDFIENDDDDIDALDIKMCDMCNYWYFSVDHEASLGLTPGSIYMYSLGAPPGPIEVIRSTVHLGIPNNHVDIDAFEFVWLLDTIYTGSFAFALLFSVDDDDPLTIGKDESGGLDPRVIYGSFLNGQFFVYLNPPLPDDVDAITAFETPELDTTLLIVPVEMETFQGRVLGKSVLLEWTTATEINNMGFEIQKSYDKNTFTTIGFVTGRGTTTKPQKYEYIDSNPNGKKIYYRLKQIDFDGTFEYSEIIEVLVEFPKKYQLNQNYPNPFNPSTIISFELPIESSVTITLFNILGEEVIKLTEGKYSSGKHEVSFNAKNLSNGVYLYKLKAEGVDGSNFSQVKKMMILK